MRKVYYAIICWIENVKSWMRCKSYNIPYNKTYVLCEFVNLREALHLMNAGFAPAKVDYHSNGAHDTFDFRRTPALLMALTDYRRAIREAVRGVDYGDYTAVCDIPGSTISPIDEMALDDIIAPRGNVREAFAYMAWPVEKRKEYINSSADSREKMVAAAYSRG